MAEEFFRWSDALSVNIRELDEQHKTLIDMTNLLQRSMNEGRDRATLFVLLAGLIGYAIKHFAGEEIYMLKTDFPGYEEHKKEHVAFTTKVHVFERRYHEGSADLSGEVMGFLQEWLSTHIQGTDKTYSPYLNERGIR
jgi:hemerythrin